MEETLGNHALSKQNVEISLKNTKHVIKLNKCNQSNYKSSYKGHLRAYMRTHSEEKSSKCNQCAYASSNASDLRLWQWFNQGLYTTWRGGVGLESLWNTLLFVCFCPKQQKTKQIEKNNDFHIYKLLIYCIGGWKASALHIMSHFYKDMMQNWSRMRLGVWIWIYIWVWDLFYGDYIFNPHFSISYIKFSS